MISEGFIKTDSDLQARDFDVNYSGTTVVSVMLAGTTLICANVGDSRAVIGSLRSKEEAKLVEQAPDSEFQIEFVAGPSKCGNTWMAT